MHGYNLHQTYLQPFTTVREPLTITTFFEYFMANGVLRFRIPLLFIISGYIYAMQDSTPYLQQIKKRAVTLILPYLIWSAIGLAITFLWQQFPVTANAVLSAKLDQLGDDRPYKVIGWWGIVVANKDNVEAEKQPDLPRHPLGHTTYRHLVVCSQFSALDL